MGKDVCTNEVQTDTYDICQQCLLLILFRENMMGCWCDRKLRETNSKGDLKVLVIYNYAV